MKEIVRIVETLKTYWKLKSVCRKCELWTSWGKFSIKKNVDFDLKQGAAKMRVW